MEPEGGVTQVSLCNIMEFCALHGKICLVEQGPEHYEGKTTITCDDGAQWEASGFAVGYRGEGPAGLAQLLYRYGRGDIRLDDIEKMDPAKAYLFLPIEIKGEKPVSIYPGVMDCEYDLEVW